MTTTWPRNGTFEPPLPRYLIKDLTRLRGPFIDDVTGHLLCTATASFCPKLMAGRLNTRRHHANNGCHLVLPERCAGVLWLVCYHPETQLEARDISLGWRTRPKVRATKIIDFTPCSKAITTHERIWLSCVGHRMNRAVTFKIDLSLSISKLQP